MKKRSFKNLTLRKHKISELQTKKGGRLDPSDNCTEKTCTCRSACDPTNCNSTIQTAV